MTVSFCSWSADQLRLNHGRSAGVAHTSATFSHSANQVHWSTLQTRLQSNSSQLLHSNTVEAAAFSSVWFFRKHCTGVIQRSALFTPAFRSAQSKSCFTNGVAYVLESLACNLTDHNKLFRQMPDSMLNFFNWRRPFPQLLKLNLWLTGWLTSPLQFWQ